MVKTAHKGQTSFGFKLGELILATVALLNLSLFPLQFLGTAFLTQYGQYVMILLGALGLLAVCGSLVYAWVWHRSELANRINSPLRHAWLLGLIRYWLAFSVATYGFAKLLKTQFQTPAFLLDVPLRELSGMDLTWYYFGYSYPFAVIIALLQLVGAGLLLYRRTTLLGVMILLPVMTNIVLIDVFYQISPGALVNAVLYSLGLLFLLSLHWQQLKKTFWNVADQLPGILSGRRWFSHGLRLLVLILPFISLKFVNRTHPDDQLLKGSWKVEKLTRNGRLQPTTAWLTDSRAWSRVYFSGAQGCAFSPNPYRFDRSESLVGRYQFDDRHNQLEVTFYSRDTLRARVRHRTTNALQLQGILGRDTLSIQLARLP